MLERVRPRDPVPDRVREGGQAVPGLAPQRTRRQGGKDLLDSRPLRLDLGGLTLDSLDDDTKQAAATRRAALLTILDDELMPVVTDLEETADRAHR